MKKLKDYQSNAIEKLSEALEKTPYCFLTLPTGAGKTFTALSFIKNRTKENPTTIWLTHRKILIEQVKKEADSMDVSNFFAMTWQKACRLEKMNYNVDYVVIDEIHYGATKNSKLPEQKSIIKALEILNPKFVIFLSATPQKLDNRAIGDVTSETQASFSRAEAYEKDILIRPDIYNVDHDDDDLFLRDSFNLTESSEALVICKNIQSCETFRKKFKNRFPDISSGVYHSKISKKEKDDTIEGFRKGSVKVLFSVNSLREGADFPFLRNVIIPELNIHNQRQFIQILGRVTRKFEGKKSARFIFRESLASKKNTVKSKLPSCKIMQDVELGDDLFSSEELVFHRALIFVVTNNINGNQTLKPKIEIISDRVCKISNTGETIPLHKIFRTKNKYSLSDFEKIKQLALEGAPRPKYGTHEGKVLKYMITVANGKPFKPEYRDFIEKHAGHWIKPFTHTRSKIYKETIVKAIKSKDFNILNDKKWRARWTRYCNKNSADFDTKIRQLMEQHLPEILPHNDPRGKFFEYIFEMAEKVKTKLEIPPDERKRMYKYISPADTKFDHGFTKELFKRRPDFFDHLSNERRSLIGLPPKVLVNKLNKIFD